MILFRLLSAQPTTDGEKWKIKGAFHADAWYTDAYGQDPAAFLRDPASLKVNQRLPFPWNPDATAALAGDKIYTGLVGRAFASSFQLTLDRGSYPATITAGGVIPANLPASSVFAPIVPDDATILTSSGTFHAGTFYLRVAWDQTVGPVSALVRATISSGATNQIQITGIRWPDSAAPGVAVFIGTSMMDMRAASFTGSANDGNGNPTTVTVASWPGVGIPTPDASFQRFAMQQTAIAHGGVWGAVVTSVTSSTVTISGAGWTTNQWAGHTLSLYFRDQEVQPLVSDTVVSNTATTLTMSHSGYRWAAGDVVVMRPLADYITSNTIGDNLFVNSFAPTGLDVGGVEIGRIIRIIGGTGAGQVGKTILSNTSTVYTINGTWDVTPDATSIFIVTEPSGKLATSRVVTNDGSGGSAVVDCISDQAAATAAQSVLVEVATADINGKYLPMRYQAFREVYIPAQNVSALSPDGEYEIPDTTVTRTLSGSWTDSATTGTLDASTGLPVGSFIATCGTECIRVTARSGASITAMDRGWGGTTAAAHSSGANFVIVTATPDLSQGKMQLETLTAHTNLAKPINSPGPGTWQQDVVQDGTGGWLLYLADDYVGFQASRDASSAFNTDPDAGVILTFTTRASGDINLSGAPVERTT